MDTILLETDPAPQLENATAKAVEALESGEVVGLPTETVYGLGADATNPEAVARIFEVKNRPHFDPLIVHLPDTSELENFVDLEEENRQLVRHLAEELWPGPLTMVLPKKDNIPDLVTAGLPTVAVRVSAHPVFRRVVKTLGRPIAAPSANRFGRISPTSASAVLEELGGKIPLILDGGACMEGLESTIIKIHPGPVIEILRAGPKTKEDLRKFAKIYKPKKKRGEDALIEAPGTMSSHYCPNTPFRLLDSPESFLPEEGKRYALLSYRGEEKDGYVQLADFESIGVLSPGSGKMPEAAVRLFFLMRQLDALGVDEIVAEPVPERGLGVAIMERLKRANVNNDECR